jgi:hypothetical protein
MTTAQKRRPGVTLMEVLVTIFIMGLGMIALLTLFPVGAVSVARALKDDRAANAAVNADGIGWAQNLRTDPLVTSSYTTGVTTTIAGPSNGVYVDPLGYLVDTNPTKTVGGVAGITRTSMSLQNYTARNSVTSLALTANEAARWCTLLDDIQFLNNGKPDPNGGIPDTASASVQRYGKYTWAWLLRQEQAGDSTLGVHAWVVVYRDRVTTLPPAPQFETPLTVVPGGVNTASNSVTVSGTNLNLRTGAWVLDITTASSGSGAVPGYFYRVVDWYVDNANSQTTLQLENGPQANTATLILMDNVVEVFDRGTAPMNQ